MPELPTHPLMNFEDPEDLQHEIRCYLALVEQVISAEMEGMSPIAGYNEVRFAMTNLLAACRDGVESLARMDAIGKVVPMTEGRS